MAAGLRVNTLCRVKVLDSKREAVECAALAFRETRIGSVRHRKCLIGRLRDIGVQSAAFFHGL